MIKTLTPGVSSRRGWLKISLFCLALFFFALGLSRPRTGARVKEMKRTGVEIMIALDVSNSMLCAGLHTQSPGTGETCRIPFG